MVIQNIAVGMLSSLNMQDQHRYIDIMNSLCNNYHSVLLIHLQDSVLFGGHKECMRRWYREEQFKGKIQSLSEYYRYHQEMPRLFQRELTETLQEYQNEKRNLEFQFVSRKINDNHRNSGRKMKPVRRLIRNIELSYCDFENKQEGRKETSKEDKLQRALRSRKCSLPEQKFPLFGLKRCNIKVSKSKEQYKNKGQNGRNNLKRKSQNLSTDLNQLLGRSKSRTVLPNLQRPLQERKDNTDKPASTIMKKTGSLRNILGRHQQLQMPIHPQPSQPAQPSQPSQPSQKNMFHKILQAKAIAKVR